MNTKIRFNKRVFAAVFASLALGATLFADETSSEFKVTYKTEGDIVTVQIQNLCPEARLFHFAAGTLTNLRPVGGTSITRACDPGVATVLLKFRKIAPDQSIQLAYQCTSEKANLTSTVPGSSAAAKADFGAHTATALVGHVDLAPSPLAGAGHVTPVALTFTHPAMPVPDAKFVYRLPFAPGQAFTVNQGYNGALSHHDRYALDFGMPFGTPVYAMRDGEVGVVVDKFPDHQEGADGLQYEGSDNNVVIDHADNTIASYLHFRMHGVTVKLHQKVKAGDLIGYVGNSGASTGAHLHVEVWNETIGSMPTLFATAAAPQGAMLAEHDSPQAP
ncbi:MAG: hypothetical protein QOK24_2732 [Verrucomicrobiota bacterium]|jgi:murein DD-endopeptidase MepM/ murein hydrolase activator NlpD